MADKNLAFVPPTNWKTRAEQLTHCVRQNLELRQRNAALLHALEAAWNTYGEMSPEAFERGEDRPLRNEMLVAIERERRPHG
jgi:hypothetical protein